MNKRSIPFLFLFFVCLSSFAQNKFSRFVEGKKIRWAIAFNDTFHFSNPNLSELLRKNFLDGKIKVALVEDPERMKQVRFESPSMVLQRMSPNADNNASAFKDSLFSSNIFNDQIKDLVEIQEIVYLEKNRLRSYAYSVSPKYLVQTSWGQVLGLSNLFTTAFRDTRSWSKSDLKKSVSLGSTTRSIVLEDAPQKSLKVLYDQSLLEAIWPFLGNKYFEIYRLDSMKKINLEDINLSLINLPVYDQNGNISSKQAAALLSPESFYSVDLVQNWYFNAGKNKVEGTISHLILYTKEYLDNSEGIIKRPILKIAVK